MKHEHKVYLLFLLIVFGFNYNSSVALDLTPSQVFEMVNNKVVVIYSFDFENKPIKQGSGIVINDSGLIVTNFHVFSECENIMVYHNNVKIGTADIIDADMEQDILVLKIDNLDLKGIQIGNSNNVNVGEKVYAIGSPMGYENTISEGIISGIRSVNNDESMLIQVTASISEGSSGGAIVNSEGELIGISTSQIKNGQNLNFAIPVNSVIDYKNSISYNKIDLEGNKTFIKGYNAYKSNKFEDAIYYYTGYLKLFDTGIAHFNRGLAYLELEKFKEAIMDFSNAINNDYSKGKVYYSRGDAYLGRGDYSMALSDYNYAVYLEPELSVPYNKRGEYYLQTGDFNNALNDFSTAIKLRGDYSLYYYNRGQANEYLKKNINAIDDYSEAINMYPDYYDAYYSRATLFNKIGNFDKAIYDFQKCIEIYPDYKYPYNNIGWVYFNKKDYKNAIYYLEKCFELDNTDWDAILGISTTHFVIGNEKKAEFFLNKAKRIEPRLRKGMDGLSQIEKDGYIYTKTQKKIIEELFDQFN